MILKKKVLAAMSMACLLTTPGIVAAEGFGINEWSTEGVAMGGARMFAEDDPANIAYNPASLTKIRGEGWKSGVVYISPHGKYKANKVDGTVETGKNVVSPGIVPHFYYARQIDEKQWFGIGSFVRFGMISEFGKTSAVSNNAYRSELKGMSITPTYAWKPDAKFSAAVGAEINYVGLTLQKTLITGAYDSKTKGESTALGWNAAVNYAFDEKNEVGLVYRSKITHTMEADFTSNFSSVPSGKVNGKVVLPNTIALGYNHKFDEKTRVELNGTYTRWSTYDKLDIYRENGELLNHDSKAWKNGWRYAIGIERKLSEKYTAMAGFAYDESAIPDEHADFMIPTGARRSYSLGLQYHDKVQTVALALGYIDIGGKSIKAKENDFKLKDAYTYDNYAKVISIGYERKL